ncbi:MAG: chromate efflux transporter [Acidobacteria bacterium]|nr:chromate efflux transporter [Acidobacteriota bacterium]
MPSVRFREAFWYWLKLGFVNFGGPAGQIALMHHELVERRRWISNQRFLHALNFCMLLPGPEAQQLAVYIGWLLHRAAGGLVAGIFFVLPSFFVLLALSWIYAVHGNLPAVAAVFHGLRAAVIAVVALAVFQIGRKALRHPLKVGVAALAFVAIFFLKVPFPAIMIAAGLVGLVAGRLWPKAFALPLAVEGTTDGAAVLDEDVPPPPHARTDLGRALLVLATGLLAWWGPLALVAWWRGGQDVLTQEAIFFSKAAMVTFGGAYAVLAYLAQAAVEQYGWLEPGEMLDGLGLAESTPGPLIMVTQFVGFLGAYRHPGELDPLLAGALGALVTVWATFAPCFLWIFLGAPYIEHLRGHKALNAALSTITAAVVGVILNLAVWFGLHTLFATVTEKTAAGIVLTLPRLTTLDPLALVLAVAAFVALARFRWPMIPVLLASAAVGFFFRLFFG